MFDSAKLIIAYANLLGWKQHYDVTDFSIGAPLLISDSGEFFQQKHPAMDLAVIRATLPNGFPLDTYLREKITDSTVEMFNDIIQYRQVNKYGKTLLQQAILLNKKGFFKDGIVNQNRFVGFQIMVEAATGLRLTINEIGLQFQGAESFFLYLFHSSLEDFILKIPVTTTGSNTWKWTVENAILNSMETANFQGGTFVLGYYQEDVTSMAINLSNFDFNVGACGSCNRSNYNTWHNIAKFFTVFPLFVPQGSFVKEKMFDIADAFFTANQTYGLNLKLTAECDLTQFFIDNKLHFKNLLSLKVVHKILNDMKFSQQINNIEENLKMMIIRDLEGDKETNHVNIIQQYTREMKAVKFNTGAINSMCLECEDAGSEPILSAL